MLSQLQRSKTEQRLRVCGKLIDDRNPKAHVICGGTPGHSGMHGYLGECVECLIGEEEYAAFLDGTHPKLRD